ncbi:hypothetical protein L484_009391 [Morus notabilis]|uniref:Uncharacterized protein n=1 Tax=Morus notabilis TaxID=981085 RepID=W9RUP6_9ROSA|nr:hypothetical protein L484_009391 [Morus notabilis]
MANLLGMLMNGLGLLTWTIWGLQERRFWSAFNLLSSAVVSITTSIVLYISMNDHRELRFSSPLFYIQS